MPVKVIDASALAAVLFSEPKADRVLVEMGEDALAAPTLLPFEIASVCLKKLRRHPKKRKAILDAYALIDQLGIETVDLPLSDAITLAERKALTLYDAVYIRLAQRLGAELVTLDRQVREAFEATRT